MLRDRAAAEVRRAAAEALGRLGRLSIAAVPALLELQNDSAEAVRKAATDALVRIVLEGEPGATGLAEARPAFEIV